jgi:hypothetical protein
MSPSIVHECFSIENGGQPCDPTCDETGLAPDDSLGQPAAPWCDNQPPAAHPPEASHTASHGDAG